MRMNGKVSKCFEIYVEHNPMGNVVKKRSIILSSKDTIRNPLLKAGFKKEELKAQADTLGNLKISGEHRIEGNRWCRFLKSFQLPKDCDARMIKAMLDEALLYVIVPKPMVKDHVSQQSNGHAHNDGGVNETRENSLAEGVANNNGEVPETSKQGMEDVANNNVQVPENSKQGMEDVAKGLSKYRKFIVKVAVAIIVVVGLGTYIAYKLRSHKRGTERM